jgi:hypothetical protein
LSIPIPHVYVDCSVREQRFHTSFPSVPRRCVEGSPPCSPECQRTSGSALTQTPILRRARALCRKSSERVGLLLGW